MQGLYYPAVLGTGLVLILFRLTMHRTVTAALGDFALYFGLLFAFFFSISFLINQDTPNEQYGLGAFLCDIVEVLLVFGAYFCLGLFNTNQIVAPDLRSVYLITAIVIVVQNGWNYAAGIRLPSLLFLSLLGLAILLSSFFWGYPHLWANITTTAILYVLLAFYYRSIAA